MCLVRDSIILPCLLMSVNLFLLNIYTAYLATLSDLLPLVTSCLCFLYICVACFACVGLFFCLLGFLCYLHFSLLLTLFFCHFCRHSLTHTLNSSSSSIVFILTKSRIFVSLSLSFFHSCFDFCLKIFVKLCVCFLKQPINLVYSVDDFVLIFVFCLHVFFKCVCFIFFLMDIVYIA